MKNGLILLLVVSFVQLTVEDTRKHKTWADVYKLVGSSLQYYWRLFLQTKQELHDHPDCGIANSAPIIPDCWESCKFVDQEVEQFYVFATSTQGGITSYYYFWTVHQRIPASWNCFWDNCYTTFQTELTQSWTQCSGNKTRGSSESFSTYVLKISKCYAHFNPAFYTYVSSTVQWYDLVPTNATSLLTNYAVHFLYLSGQGRASYSGTYSDSDTGKRKKRQAEDNIENRNKLFAGNKREIEKNQSSVISIPENISTRFQGASPQIPNKERGNGIKYPWSCSLRSSGYRSFHKCGVTMLSGPPGPTILVSAAHCNYICKDADDNLNESCCCNQLGDPGHLINCRDSVYCGPDPKTLKAEAHDLTIVCGEISVDIENQYFSPEKEVVLKLKEFHNHPLYDPEDILKGYDIAVYIVDDEKLKDSSYFNKQNIWPVCLPRGDDQYEIGEKDLKARVSGWDVPDFLSRNIGALNFQNFLAVEQGTFFNKEVLMEKIDCTDHPKMGTNTYYPSRGSCFRDPTMMTCPNFGVSGSGLFRPFKDSGYDKYSYFGPLSFHRGCQYFLVNNFGSVTGETLTTGSTSSRGDQSAFIRQSRNPTLFTDARCFMPWIAANYGMKMPDNYAMPESCQTDLGTGNKEDKNNEDCYAQVLAESQLQKCNLTKSEELYGIRECWSYNTEGYTDHSYNCITDSGDWGTCVNNCPGVRGNAVVVGGGAVLFASSLGGGSFVAPFTVAAAGLLGTMANTSNRNSRCPEVCQLRAGGCLRGRRCAILLRSSR